MGKSGDKMVLRTNSLYKKEVININDGTKLGIINDIEIDISTGQILSIIILKEMRFFGLFGKEDDYILPWEHIQVLGNDAVLVNSSEQSTPYVKKDRKNLLKSFFE